MKNVKERQEEILNIGWLRILEKYHPTMNTFDPYAEMTFLLYTEVFVGIKKALHIEYDYVFAKEADNYYAKGVRKMEPKKTDAEQKEYNDRILEKFNEIQLEILNIGWTGILKRYHPEMNEGHPEAMKIFQLYKEIYSNMKKRLLIEYDGLFPNKEGNNGK